MSRVLRCAFGAPTLLAVVADAAGKEAEFQNPRWVQVCTAGEYRGHPAAPKLTWDRSVFDEVIENFRRHPSYKAGAGGIGEQKVIPYDYEHASEMAPTEGTIPQQGAGAPGWVMDLEVRTGQDGREELWAWSFFGAKAVEQIKAEEYRWTSVAVAPHFIDPVTGDDAGHTLTSVALTNHPFIQGMRPIAARLDQWGYAESQEELLVGLRQLFEMRPDASAADVAQQIAEFRELASLGGLPAAVAERAPSIVDSIRRLLGMPLLASADAVLGGAEQALASMAAGDLDPSTNPETSTMALGIMTALATILGSASDTEGAVLAAAKESAEKAAKADGADEAVDAISKLKELFGSKETGDLLAKAAKSVAEAQQIGPALEQLAALQAAMRDGAEKTAEAEATAVAASMNANPAVKRAILFARKACIKPDGTLSQEAHAQWLKDFAPEAHQHAVLTQSIVAGANGVQLGGPVTGYQTQPIQSAAPTTASDDRVARVVEQVNQCSGRNAFERVNAFLCAAKPGHREMGWEEQSKAAQAACDAIKAGRMPLGVQI
jgi:hypothetical protein